MDPADPIQDSGSVLPPLVISVTGIVVCSVIMIAYHILLVKFCMRTGEQGAEIPTASAQNPVLIVTGVEQKILETIPIVYFSRENVADSNSDQTECVVCLGELEEGDTVRVLPVCNHVFHVQCIDHWFKAHTSCPVCRSPVVVTTAYTDESAESNIDGDDERLFQEFLPRSVLPQEHELQAVSNSGVQSKSMLRHCVSLVFPRETKPKHLITGLKRSLSMDQSYVLINLTEDNEKDCSSSSSSMFKTNSYKARSMRQFDRMSSLLKSLSQWRIGRINTVKGILPY